MMTFLDWNDTIKLAFLIFTSGILMAVLIIISGAMLGAVFFVASTCWLGVKKTAKHKSSHDALDEAAHLLDIEEKAEAHRLLEKEENEQS